MLRMLGLMVAATIVLTGCSDAATEAADAAHTAQEAKEAQDALIANLDDPTQLAIVLSDTSIYCNGGLGPCHFTGISKHFKPIPAKSKLVTIAAAPYGGSNDGAFKLTFHGVSEEQCKVLTRPAIATNFIKVSIETSGGQHVSNCSSNAQAVVLLGR